MSYANRNFPTKKALKEAVAAGDLVTIYNPGLGSPPLNGPATIEGPHFPQPHKWYAEVEMRDGRVVGVK